MAPSNRPPPPGWPPDTRYVPILDLTNPRIDPDLRQQMRKLVSTYQSIIASRGVPPSKLVRIRTITDPHHPAFGQRGLFVAQNLKPRQWIINYGGELVRDDEPQAETSDYCLGYGKACCIDACNAGNESRFVNDYRGVPGATRNNVEFSEYEPPSTAGDIAIVGFRVGPLGIKRGDELLTSYGKGFWRGRGMNSRRDEASDCPGRHGWKEIDIPVGSSFYCSLCSETVDSTASAGFRYCQRCAFGACERCRTNG